MISPLHTQATTSRVFTNGTHNRSVNLRYKTDNWWEQGKDHERMMKLHCNITAKLSQYFHFIRIPQIDIVCRLRYIAFTVANTHLWNIKVHHDCGDERKCLETTIKFGQSSHLPILPPTGRLHKNSNCCDPFHPYSRFYCSTRRRQQR